jgi:hypothetical protein
MGSVFLWVFVDFKFVGFSGFQILWVFMGFKFCGFKILCVKNFVALYGFKIIWVFVVLKFCWFLWVSSFVCLEFCGFLKISLSNPKIKITLKKFVGFKYGSKSTKITKYSCVFVIICGLHTLDQKS